MCLASYIGRVVAGGTRGVPHLSVRPGTRRLHRIMSMMSTKRAAAIAHDVGPKRLRTAKGVARSNLFRSLGVCRGLEGTALGIADLHITAQKGTNLDWAKVAKVERHMREGDVRKLHGLQPEYTEWNEPSTFFATVLMRMKLMDEPKPMGFTESFVDASLGDTALWRFMRGIGTEDVVEAMWRFAFENENYCMMKAVNSMNEGFLVHQMGLKQVYLNKWFTHALNGEHEEAIAWSKHMLWFIKLDFLPEDSGALIRWTWCTVTAPLFLHSRMHYAEILEDNLLTFVRTIELENLRTPWKACPEDNGAVSCLNRALPCLINDAGFSSEGRAELLRAIQE